MRRRSIAISLGTAVVGLAVVGGFIATRPKGDSSPALSHGASPGYASIDQIASTSTVILRGTVFKELSAVPVTSDGASEAPNSDGFYRQAYTVEVQTVYKGEPGSSQITVGSLRPSQETNAELRAESEKFMTGLQVGQDVVLFLGSEAFGEYVDGWVPVGSDWGIFDLSDESGATTAAHRMKAEAIPNAVESLVELERIIANAPQSPAFTPGSGPAQLDPNDPGGKAATTTSPPKE